MTGTSRFARDRKRGETERQEQSTPQGNHTRAVSLGKIAERELLCSIAAERTNPIKAAKKEEGKMDKELDEMQKRILKGCLRYEKTKAIPTGDWHGVEYLCADIKPVSDEEAECLDVKKHWVSDLVGRCIEKNSEGTYRLTEEGLAIAKSLA